MTHPPARATDDDSTTSSVAPRRARPPLDPRLVREIRPVRRYLISGGVLAVAQTFATIGLAIALGGAMARVITAGASLAGVQLWLMWVAIFIVARVVLTYVQVRTAQNAAGNVIASLQERVLRTTLNASLRHVTEVSGERVTVTTSGLEALRSYFTGYLPQLLAAAILTPAVVVVVFWFDPLSALIAVLTLPLIPVFMWLIGRLTEGRSAARLVALGQLESQHQDLLAGLPTLLFAGRAREMGARVRTLAQNYRQTSMATLRYAFLSALVLEWLTTLCVALIAVAIGLRLINGDMTLEAGLVVLILAPDIYLPLRQLGAQFHASEDGLAALDAAFDASIADAAHAKPAPVASENNSTLRHDVGVAPLVRFTALSVAARSGFAPFEVSGDCRPGAITALSGASGSGKTTALYALLGEVDVASGGVEVVGDTGAASCSVQPGEVAYLEQRPIIFPASVRENLTVFLPAEAQRGDADLLNALGRAGLGSLIRRHRDILAVRLGTGGVGLSRGEAQRVAIARLLLHPGQLVIADEPTAHLDLDTEATVISALRALAGEGRTVIMVAHRPELLRHADAIIEVRGSHE